MQAKDIVPGNRYICTISGERREVLVTARLQDRNGRTVFAVRRVDRIYGAALKNRSAAALHPLPGSPEEHTESERLAKLAAKPKRPRCPREPHASMSCREYAEELRFWANACIAWNRIRGERVPLKREVAAFIRTMLRRHLQNRATWLAMTVLRQSDDAWRAALLYERRKFGTSRMACTLAPMLGADPQVLDSIITHVVVK